MKRGQHTLAHRKNYNRTTFFINFSFPIVLYVRFPNSIDKHKFIGRTHMLNTVGMELDLQSLFGLHVHSCTHWLRPRNPPPPPPTRHLGSYTRALFVSQDRGHIFVTPWSQSFAGSGSRQHRSEEHLILPICRLWWYLSAIWFSLSRLASLLRLAATLFLPRFSQ